MATVTMHPGIYLSPTDDPASITSTWVRGGSTVIGTGQTSPDLAVGDNVGALIEYVEQAGNLSGLTTERRITVQEQGFPNYLRLADIEMVLAPNNENATAFTFAGRFRFNSWDNFQSSFRIGITANPFRLRHRGAAMEILIIDSAGTVLSDWESTGITRPLNDTWNSYVVAVDLSAGLPGGVHLSFWMNGQTFTHTLSSTGTSQFLSSPGMFYISQAGAPDIEEFILYDYGRAVDPVTLAPLLFDTANGYVARDIIASPPMGPWRFALGGPVQNWTSGANLGDDATVGLDSRTTPVTETTA